MIGNSESAMAKLRHWRARSFGDVQSQIPECGGGMSTSRSERSAATLAGHKTAQQRANQPPSRFDPQRELCHVAQSKYMAIAMPLAMNDRVVVHVVDDDSSTRGALEELFLTVGLATRTYGAARDFLNSGFTDTPGCIVIDIRLPDMNGLELQAQLTEAGIRLPVVMITGY